MKNAWKFVSIVLVLAAAVAGAVGGVLLARSGIAAAPGRP